MDRYWRFGRIKFYTTIFYGKVVMLTCAPLCPEILDTILGSVDIYLPNFTASYSSGQFLVLVHN